MQTPDMKEAIQLPLGTGDFYLFYTLLQLSNLQQRQVYSFPETGFVKGKRTQTNGGLD